jgi:hypothetical protein
MRNRHADPELERIRRLPPQDGLFASPPDSPAVDRHVTAIASVSASALPGETEIVERVIAAMREMELFSADDVCDALDREGVPDTLEIRRRYSSRVTNGIRNKVSRGTVMTRHRKRSGRPVTLWLVVPLADGGE